MSLYKRLLIAAVSGCCALLSLPAAQAQWPVIGAEPAATGPRVFERPATKTATNPRLDTLKPPFIESFSTGEQPDSTLWVNQDRVFFSRTSLTDGIDYGTVILDGLNADRFPYSTTEQPGPTDVFTTQCLDLTDWQPQDQVYFSFWYRGSPILDAPDGADSLRLYITWRDSTTFDTTTNSHFPKDSLLWFAAGEELDSTAWAYQNQVLLEPSFFDSACVQFRFQTIGLMSGPWDVWHLDYLRLDSGRNERDTFALTDVGIRYISGNLLDTVSQALHRAYQQSAPAQLQPVTVTLANLGRTAQSTTGEIRLVDLTINQVLETQAFTQQLDSGATAAVTATFNAPTLSTPTELALVAVLTSPDDHPGNDSAVRHFPVGPRKALDDGESERSFGLTDDRAFAQRFRHPGQDSIQAVWLSFRGEAPLPPTMRLAIWDANPLNTYNPDSTFHFQFVAAAGNTGDAASAMVRVALDTAVLPPSPCFIGLVQQTNASAKLGFDLSRDAHTDIFFDFNGNWRQLPNQEQYRGTLMLQPEFARNDIVATAPSPHPEVPFQVAVYPNPTSGSLHLEWALQKGHTQRASAQLMRMDGSLAAQTVLPPFGGAVTWALPETVPPGTYLLVVQLESSNAPLYLDQRRIILTR